MTASSTEPLTHRGLPRDTNLRVLAAGTFASRFGSGAVMVTSALYFTRQVGLSPAHVATALSIAGIVGLLVQVPAGHLGDTRGPREVMAVLMAGAALFASPPALATTPLALAITLGLLAAFERSAMAVRAGLIAQVATGGRGVLFKAYLRAVTNVAIGLGSVAGGAALLIDEKWAYVSVFALNAVFTALSAAVTMRMEHVPPHPVAEGEPRLAVVRDLPFLVLTVLTGFFSLHFLVMDLGLALYIAARTEAPTVMVAVILILNTAAVAALQVRLSKRSDTVMSSAGQLIAGGLFIAVGFAFTALASQVGAALAVVALLVGASIHVIGEMIGSGGQWGVQMGLAPHERQGQYQGFAGLSWSVLEILGPPLVVYMCVDLGGPGWLLMGAATVAVALLCVPVCRWALATRERYGVVNYSG
ncbi:MAG: MFS transporter [Nocardioides sp.]|uniref:MFS transporter n=1 Tax=Nocardioides sp. TaxID=35761 RepID=UPI003F0A38A1